MPSTVPQAFQTLKTNLEITGLQAATVSTRQQTVRGVVAAGLTVVDDFLTGSYSRDTMIAPLKEADVDIFTVLDVKYFHQYNNGLNGGQAGLLDLTKRTLLRTYTRTPDISRNGQAVTIRFEDFIVDVIPAFHRQGGGFLIPNALSGTWISTDPKKHIELLTQANAAHDGNLVPLIKMIKGWNRTIDRHFRSFHLEVMAMAIMTNVTISDFPSGLRFFFDKARTLVTQQNPDPAGYGGDVGSYLNTQAKISEATQRFQTAYEHAVTAERLAAQGHLRPAFEAWGKIFGDFFPAYGY
ncbi:MAG TPA: CBASS oligonucleotide cyclase [Lacunisphaera sp.]|nr:CBASS oligonucleotide cyclase [Lacunisphaera sp.]